MALDAPIADVGLDFSTATASVTAEVVVAGRTVSASSPRSCAHRVQLNTDCLVAFIEEADDSGDGPFVRHEIRLRVRCGECGCAFALDPASARLPRDGGHGVVLRLSPIRD